jgi:hypothetical protein
MTGDRRGGAEGRHDPNRAAYLHDNEEVRKASP